MIMDCETCQLPWVDPDDASIRMSLAAVPIPMCDCMVASLREIHYSTDEYAEAYRFALQLEGDDEGLTVAIETSDLCSVGWIIQSGEVCHLTRKGLRMFPLLVTISTDLAG